MATENKPKSVATNSKKRKQRYLPHNKPVKKKGSYPLHPGVQGFFITCDGGRERQASHEAINVIDSFYEELVHAKDTSVKLELPKKPSSKKIKFVYSDDEEDDDDNGVEGEEEEEDKEEDKEEGNKSDTKQNNDDKNDNPANEKLEFPNVDKTCNGNQTEKNTCDNEAGGKDEHQTNETDEPPAKKQIIETCVSSSVVHEKVEQRSIDKLIEDELKELGDKSKRRFTNLDSGCNGVVFVQMRKRDGDPSPKDIAQHIMTSAASTRKHMSRFILRVLPVEIACYASEEEISKAMAPIVEKYFPVDTQNPQKFAVLYEARANTGIDRMKIINSVAKSVPGPHKVDLNNPDKTIVVEIVKTVCLIGLVENYKGLAKYNLRQLTSPK
ncbi:ribosome quality control complex subunit 2 [Ricinus communis]|uniref:Thump domain protein, putative n=1 Tax=Ricinus communis TaxID=3988 RepID=B9RIG8_RICCO|nr:ribosome quality control complex subunit 2 [Ricinus communis]EEF48940.1 thump domain protein, putative [Ricinus communis]|eukprot:XP_002513537.1 ribosome quality control complex subunit 2 [Ricinus communis]